jgi:hypothetical protein
MGEGAPDREEMIARMEREMLEAAQKLEFEVAATLRDRILELRAEGVMAGGGGARRGAVRRERGRSRSRGRR